LIEPLEKTMSPIGTGKLLMRMRAAIPNTYRGSMLLKFILGAHDV